MTLEKIVFIDIETAPMVASFQELPSRLQELWKKKLLKETATDESPDWESLYMNRAAIFAEFGKIICISVGLYSKKDEVFKIKSFYSENESELLNQFVAFTEKIDSSYSFCGHNIREFDIPYISRRLLINLMPIPSIIDFQEKKPWEVQMIDTMQLWKFGDYKNFTSLDLLTAVFNITSPKNDIDGSMVGTVFWVEKDLTRIVAYCENDVLALIQLYHCLHQKPQIDSSKIIKIK